MYDLNRNFNKACKMSKRSEGGISIRQQLEFLFAGNESFDLETPPPWPPDVFAAVGLLLLRSGAYARVLKSWPPKEGREEASKSDWVNRVRRVGRKWRLAYPNDEPPPREVGTWWAVLLQHADIDLDAIAREDREEEYAVLVGCLLQLFAAADEACQGVGLPPSGSRESALTASAKDRFLYLANSRLIRSSADGRGGATLCWSISWSRVRVLPKMHTPQSGMTLRSLSHHLALAPSDDLLPRWQIVPTSLQHRENVINLLVMPWPLEIVPADFKAVREPDPTNPFGLFGFSPAQTSVIAFENRFKALLHEAKRNVGTTDGIVLPEVALSLDELQVAKRLAHENNAFLVTGIRGPRKDSTGQVEELNACAFQFPGTASFEQKKHHRWRLDRRQIVQYGLGSQLDPQFPWWESFAMSQRELYFFSMRAWLALSVLICEDLARQEPVAEIIRAVGPNLVIALLMDGPQKEFRWSSRYATVFADDPGSSVLTLTSLGMARLSRPPKGAGESRVVALWKDGRTSEMTEIELPSGCDGLVLTLTREFTEELCADGRGDGGSAGFPSLTGIFPLCSSLFSAKGAKIPEH